MKARFRLPKDFWAIIAGSWLWAAVLCIPLVKRFPFLHSFSYWTIGIYVGAVVLAALVVMVVGPGVYLAKELYENISDPDDSHLEHCFVLVWCGVSGLLLSALLGGAAALICCGVLAQIKLWFLGVCFLILFVPWVIVGYVTRILIRRIDQRGKPKQERF